MNEQALPNVNDIYFDGIYKELWRSLIPQKLTDAEVAFMIKSAELSENSSVLDLMCGYGRHALGLARHGCRVTAVDNLPAYIKEIEAISLTENLPIECIKSGALEWNFSGQFDLVICMGNSINFFNKLDTAIIFSKVFQYLKPGGRFLINSWSITEIAVKDFIASHTGTCDGVVVETKSEYLFSPTRIETINTFISPDGQKEIKKAIDYIFSFAELEEMLQTAGFRIVSAESIPGKKAFSLGDPRLYLVAEKAR